MSKGKRKTSVVAMMAVLASLLVPMALASPASAVGAPSSDFKICRGDVLQTDYIVNPYGQGFICAEASPTNYSGNGGKGWNEFDLVPFRLILTTGNNEAQSYTFGVAVDSLRNGVPGYDRITVPSVNTALSTGTDCNITNVGPTTTKTPGFTYNESIYRIVTVTLSNAADCVIDYDARIAIGAHLFNGASMHGNITDGTASGTNQDRSIQTGELLPQAINKDMTAVRDVDHTWNITKSATPATINLGDTCATPNPTNSTVSVSVTWTRGPATPSGMTHITANIYATNPSHRSITASVVDRVYEGTTQTTLIHTSAPFVKVITANQASVLVGTDSFDTASTATTFNDVATASYTDTVFNEPVPGQTTATATANVGTGSELNASAVIKDVESITGTGLSFSTDSVVDSSAPGDTGGAQALDSDTFERPVGTAYTPGTLGTAPVTWTSSPVSASGSVTFAKTVKFTGSGDVSGALDDTASFATNSTPPVTGSATGHIGITANTIATLTITKNVDVAPAANTIFQFNVTGPGGFSSQVNVTVLAGATSGSNTLGGLADGNYNVSEVDTPDYTEDTDKPFTISAGECTDAVTFNNTLRRAHIVVDKVTDPTGSAQSFNFTASYDADGFSLTDADTPNDSGPLLPGKYNVAETVPVGWDQTSATCDHGETIDDIDVAAGETVTCTFVNTQRGNIIVKKVTGPAGSAQVFNFTASYDADGFALTDGQQNDSGLLVPGKYNVAETGVSGWDLTSATCDKGETISDIDVGAGETVTCTFTNTRQTGNIIVDKVTDPAGSSQSFNFTASYNAAGFSLTDAAPPNDSGPLPTGIYSVAETGVPGWDLTSATCSDGSDPAAIDLGSKETVTCTFVNTQRGNIIVKKVTDPTGSPQSFEFTPSYNGGTKFSLTDGQQNDSGLLVPGKYNVAETAVPGWDLTSATCDKGETISDIDVGAGETVTCTFVNTQRGAIEITKTFNGQPPAAGSSYTFQLRTGASQGVEGDIKATLTLNSGNNFVGSFSNLVPGDYQVCETNIPVGGHSDLSDRPGAFTPTPDPGDNSTQCAPITVGAGETVKITVNNTPPPGGDQRTIGYWKNWASCAGSNGKQAPKLDQTLFAAGVNGISVGKLVLMGGTTANLSPDCLKAIRILDKSDIVSGKKQASDPAYNLAAQLLAAKLNVVAGAGQCPAATQAISDAQNLLFTINFTGTGTYIKTMTTAQKNLANQLATTLDQYNNGSLC